MRSFTLPYSPGSRGVAGITFATVPLLSKAVMTCHYINDGRGYMQAGRFKNEFSGGSCNKNIFVIVTIILVTTFTSLVFSSALIM